MAAAMIELGGAESDSQFFEAVDFVSPSGRRIIVKHQAPTAERLNTIARHRARYYPAGLFCRPGRRVLDFPCGSGYSAEIFRAFGVQYHGLDHDEDKVAYAQHVYGAEGVTFRTGDLTKPDLRDAWYDVVVCVEGIEHIRSEFQAGLIRALRQSLKSEGVLVISSPENVTGKSGPNPDNKWHVHELNKSDFLSLLTTEFGQHVEPVHFREELTDGHVHTCWVAVCHKKG
jgi:2-polyprenyl-3-methyl-5-hydroxy-6-metoxy-1,4-benzoquinol methylase